MTSKQQMKFYPLMFTKNCLFVISDIIDPQQKDFSPLLTSGGQEIIDVNFLSKQFSEGPFLI